MRLEPGLVTFLPSYPDTLPLCQKAGMEINAINLHPIKLRHNLETSLREVWRHQQPASYSYSLVFQLLKTVSTDNHVEYIYRYSCFEKDPVFGIVSLLLMFLPGVMILNKSIVDLGRLTNKDKDGSKVEETFSMDGNEDYASTRITEEDPKQLNVETTQMIEELNTNIIFNKCKIMCERHDNKDKDGSKVEETFSMDGNEDFESTRIMEEDQKHLNGETIVVDQKRKSLDGNSAVNEQTKDKPEIENDQTVFVSTKDAEGNKIEEAVCVNENCEDIEIIEETETNVNQDNKEDPERNPLKQDFDEQAVKKVEKEKDETTMEVSPEKKTKFSFWTCFPVLGCVSICCFPLILTLYLIGLVPCCLFSPLVLLVVKFIDVCKKCKDEKIKSLSLLLGSAEGKFESKNQLSLQLFIAFTLPYRQFSTIQLISMVTSLLMVTRNKIKEHLTARHKKLTTEEEIGKKLTREEEIGKSVVLLPLFLTQAIYESGFLALTCALLRYNCVTMFVSVGLIIILIYFMRLVYFYVANDEDIKKSQSMVSCCRFVNSYFINSLLVTCNILILGPITLLANTNPETEMWDFYFFWDTTYTLSSLPIVKDIMLLNTIVGVIAGSAFLSFLIWYLQIWRREKDEIKRRHEETKTVFLFEMFS